MNDVLEKDRVDEIEVGDDKFVVSYDENTIPGKVDARVVDYSDRFFLENDENSLGSVEVLEKGVAENPDDAIEYLEDNYGSDSSDELEDLISF